jgi:hypothetical protein
MGMFAEAAIVDYRLSFADIEKKLLFSISVPANKQKFALSVFCLQPTN